MRLARVAELADRSGGSETATLGLARVLRKLARIGEARHTLAPLASQPEPSPSVQVEMANIELELGNYEQAERRFRQMPLEISANDVLLIPAALTLALRRSRSMPSGCSPRPYIYNTGMRQIIETAGQQSATRRDGFA